MRLRSNVYRQLRGQASVTFFLIELNKNPSGHLIMPNLRKYTYLNPSALMTGRQKDAESHVRKYKRLLIK